MLDSLGLKGEFEKPHRFTFTREMLPSLFHLVLFLMLATGCQENNQVSERIWSERVQLKKIHVLGLSPEDWVTRPTEVTESNDGTVLVSDHGRMQILRYDANGDLIGRIGGRGRDAGRFLHISSFAADSSGSVVVFDNILARSTIFDKEGLVVRTDSLDRHDILWPRQLVGTVDTLLGVYKLPDRDNRGVRRTQSAFLIHRLVLTPKGYQVEHGFGRATSVADVRLHAVERYMQLKPGYILPFSTNIWYAPPLADGRLVRFNHDGLGAGIVTRGWDEPNRSFELLTESPPDSTRKNMLIFTASKNNRSGITLLRESLGLYAYEEEYIVHLYMDRSVNINIPNIEVDIYNHEGIYQFSGNLTGQIDYASNEFGFSPVRIHYLSQLGILYVSGILGPDTISVFQFDVQSGDGST